MKQVYLIGQELKLWEIIKNSKKPITAAEASALPLFKGSLKKQYAASAPLCVLFRKGVITRRKNSVGMYEFFVSDACNEVTEDSRARLIKRTRSTLNSHGVEINSKVGKTLWIKVGPKAKFAVPIKYAGIIRKQLNEYAEMARIFNS